MKSEIPDSLYESLFDKMLDGLAYGQMVFDDEGRAVDYIYMRVNKNFEALTGLKDVEGKKVSEVLPEIRTSNPDWIEAHGRVSSTGKPEQFEVYLSQLSRWFFVSLYSLRKGSFASVFQNITERKRSDKELEKFKLALDNISDNVIITDPEGIVVYANKAVEKVTGYAPEEAIGKKSGALWKTPMPQDYYRKMWDIIKNQKKNFAGEIQNRKKNGVLYTADISISPIIGRNGEIEFFVSVEHDVTKEREMDRAKSEFMSLASHQLRTPPSIINWYAETLLGGDLGTINKKQTEYLREIDKANQRMISIINSLLNISRIEMGTFSVSPKKIDIKSIIDETSRELMSRFGRMIEVKKSYDPNLGQFSADPSIVQIIIENLLSNAFKYSLPEKTNIEVSAKMENGSLLLSVKDDGIGISANDRDMIFERLFRADNAVAMDPDGTGLGLYMIKKIITEGLGGDIWFDSPTDMQNNKGSVFFVRIPASGTKERTGTTTLVP